MTESKADETSLSAPGCAVEKSQTRRHLCRTVEQKPATPRLDQYLAAAFSDDSRGFWKKAVGIGSVHIDGRRVSQCSRQLYGGEKIEVFLDGLPLEKHVISADQVLFQDKDLLALNKPAGLDTQPTPSRYQGTLYQGILDYLGRSRGKGRKPEIGMVQRLDRDTSGVLVFSIHPRAHRSLSAQVQEHQLKKTYLALVGGQLEQASGEFSSQLAKVRATNLVHSVAKGGKPALTRYRLLAANSNVSLVEVELVTGRMHQIRAHFSEAGHPLVGDSRYGGVTSVLGMEAKRQMLHSWKLFMSHPFSGNPQQFVAPLPPDWFPFLAACGFEEKLCR